MSQAGNSEVEMANVEKTNEFQFVGKEGREGEKLFIESFLNRLDGQEREGFASSQAGLEGMGFLKD